MEDRFKRLPFETQTFLTESSRAPKIKSGAPSSSNVLNRFFQAIARDLSLLTTRTNTLAARQDRLENGASAMAGALSGAIEAAYTAVNAIVDGSLTEVLADMYSGHYVVSATNVEVDYLFGQATLAYTSSTDLLVDTDVYGDQTVSRDVEVSSVISATEPDNLDFTVDPDALFMLVEQQLWLKPEASSGDIVWIKLKAPLQFRGLLPNVLDFYPFPPFGMDLLEVAYQEAGGGGSSEWTALDLSYLPRYDTGEVLQVAPVRLHLPGVPISALRFQLRLRGDYAWGVHKIKLYNRQYRATGELVVEDPFSRTIGATTLRGKDPSTVLSVLQTIRSGNEAEVRLATSDATATPVVTGVILSV